MLETDLRPMEEVADAYVDHMADLALDLPRGEQRQMYLMEDLLDADWKPKEPSNDWSQPWLRHAARLLDRGDVERAGKAMARVTAPESLMAARADHRFAPLLRKDPARFDLAGAHAARIAARRAEVQAKPRQLAAVNVLAMALLAADRDAETLTTTRAALARPADAWDDPHERAWTFDIQARALRDLGRADEALAAWREAALVDQGDRGNISQILNLADALLELGHPAETLALLDRLQPDQVSGYGRMVAADLAVCARVQTNDPPGLERALAALAADRDAAPSLELGGLLCAGRTDAAAASLIAQLKDPDTRLEALADVQDYPADPAATPFRREQLARRRALQARPDVRAAIAAVGRVERQPHPTIY
jgi:tetratricopeptide (TPR) repeat protein